MSKSRRNSAAIRLNMGDGAVLEISEGDTTPATKAVDREDATMVPVFRLYGYDHYKDRMEQAGADCL
jgi:hypothetical protein